MKKFACVLLTLLLTLSLFGCAPKLDEQEAKQAAYEILSDIKFGGRNSQYFNTTFPSYMCELFYEIFANDFTHVITGVQLDQKGRTAVVSVAITTSDFGKVMAEAGVPVGGVLEPNEEMLLYNLELLGAAVKNPDTERVTTTYTITLKHIKESDNWVIVNKNEINAIVDGLYPDSILYA